MNPCWISDCSKLTSENDPNAIIVYDDSYSNVWRTMFCSQNCVYRCRGGWSMCYLCARRIWGGGTSFNHLNFIKYGLFVNICHTDELVCKRCFSGLLLQNGQNVPESMFSTFKPNAHCHSIELFQDITPKQFGYVQVPGFTNVSCVNLNSNSDLALVFSRSASDFIANRCMVLVLLSNTVTFDEWLNLKKIIRLHSTPLDVVKYKKETERLTLWCYGLYHGITRNAVVTWLLCAPGVLKKPGYCYPKDIGRLIGKIVYATRNDPEAWSHLFQTNYGCKN